MRIRTITVGFTADDFQDLLGSLAAHIQAARTMGRILEGQGYEVQTLRLATNSFEQYLNISSLGPEGVIEKLIELDKLLTGQGIDFFNIGPATEMDTINLIPDIIKSTKRLSVSARLENGDEKFWEKATASAETIIKISRDPPDGLGNFRSVPEAKAAYESLLYSTLQKLENSILLSTAPAVSGYSYAGIDASLNPSLDKGASLVLAYEELLGKGKFGGPGTVAISALITTVIREAPIKLAGYSGLMLPVLEDELLAERTSIQPPTFGISELVAISAVCGVGIDTVPIPGDVSVKNLSGLLMDVAAISFKYNKPLSCRLFPVAGKGPGEYTAFESPYLCNTRIFRL